VPTSSLPLSLLEFEHFVGGMEGEIIAEKLEGLFDSRMVAADEFVDLLDGLLNFRV
jgi:hypothetical protein